MRIEQEKKNSRKITDFIDKTLLIVDDDVPLRDRLSRAMEKKGFQVIQAESVKKGISEAKNAPPAFAVVDLRLADGNGLEVVKEIRRLKEDSRVVMLTGYGNIPTAVAAVKAGAIDYIPKPADADDVESALLASPESKATPPPKIPCLQIELNGNISIEFLNYAIETFPKLHEDLKCTEEHYKEFFLRDLLNNFY